MSRPSENTLVIAISTRALFDLSESHRVFVEEGISAYCRYQIERENELLPPGVAFPMVQKFLALNDTGEDGGAPCVEIVLISRNSADTGLRIFNSIEHYGLNITRAAFTSGGSPYKYVKPFGADLFLSADPEDVALALSIGHAAATILPSEAQEQPNDLLKIAFDGDSVLFSDASDRIYREKGIVEFAEHERKSARQPLPGGPFKNFLSALHRIQQERSDSPIRTALVTSRAAPAHERVIRTLRAWNIRIDESYFLGGMDKGTFLKCFGADIFFDDHFPHCDTARRHVPTGHVPVDRPPD
ncbi:MAG: 5'-nucleotidase [Gammaproteobacteria bacterium]|nr:5'-nucleotidase [Gammaproteobacteria bacterium]MYD75737.1 5'-nucleotidase [Gammaproteobacteria bacterium]